MAKFNWRRVQIEDRDRRSRNATQSSTWEFDLSGKQKRRLGSLRRRARKMAAAWLSYTRRQRPDVVPLIGRHRARKRTRLRASRNWRTFLTLQALPQTRRRGVAQ